MQKTELKNIEWYMDDGIKDTTDKFQMFNEWCKEEGVIMPKLQYPAYFEGNLLGVRCTEEIKHREAYMFVPYKMVISLNKIMQHPVVSKIIQENPECFNKDEFYDYQHMILTLFIFHEITLGRWSYWYPYLRLLPDVEITSSWSEEEKTTI